MRETRARKRDPIPTEQDPRWRAVVARDPAADGKFFYSVKSSGVYCFPSCHARLARPENVRFHLTREDAERAGFRPCKRCKPDRREGRRALPAARIEVDIEPSSLGLVLVARSADGESGSERGICAVLIGDDRDDLTSDLRRRFPGAAFVVGGRDLRALARKVAAYVDAPSSGVEVPLDPRGTDFQRIVWRELRRIPAGSTASYTEIARRIGRPTSARAVAHACATNPLAVLVPCHRVVTSDGRLSGYRWGVERKKALLEKEGAI